MCRRLRASSLWRPSEAGLGGTPKIPARRDTGQELLGHASVETTMIYTHVLNRGGHGVRSPLDALLPPRASSHYGVMARETGKMPQIPGASPG